MEHESVECILNPSTKLQTSVISYLYTCPSCGEQRRYAYPSSGETVFCDGLDWRTDICEIKSSDAHTFNLSEQYLEVIKPYLVTLSTLQNRELVFDPRGDWDKQLGDVVALMKNEGMLDYKFYDIVKGQDHYQVNDIGLRVLQTISNK